MKVRDQLHAPAAFTAENKPPLPLPIKYEAGGGGGAQADLRLRRREKFLNLPQIEPRFFDCPAHSPVTHWLSRHVLKRYRG
jgi:hypothetical protein